MIKNKKRVVVLMGGKSPEHEISLISGMQIVSNLDTEKYDVLPAVISKDGTKLQLVSSVKLLTSGSPLKLKGTKNDFIKNPDNELKSISEIDRKTDLIFIAMHGPFGEDGRVQGMLELLGIPYTGSGVLASALGMDKIAFRKYLSAESFKIPNYVVLKKAQRLNLKKVNRLLGKLPYFVKPNNQGSSVGNSLARTNKQLIEACKKALNYSDQVLIDEYIQGTEVTVGVLGNERPVALPVVEIVPLKGEYFDYDSKYTERGSDEIVPARLPKTLAKLIQDLATKVHVTLGCRGFSRVDFILRGGSDPYILEINTIPGMTPMSLLPKAAEAAGIPYAKLLDIIIDYAFKKN